jgi:hypothetical protein
MGERASEFNGEWVISLLTELASDSKEFNVTAQPL